MIIRSLPSYAFRIGRVIICRLTASLRRQTRLWFNWFTSRCSIVRSRKSFVTLYLVDTSSTVAVGCWLRSQILLYHPAWFFVTVSKIKFGKASFNKLWRLSLCQVIGSFCLWVDFFISKKSNMTVFFFCHIKGDAPARELPVWPCHKTLLLLILTSIKKFACFPETCWAL